MTCNAVFRLSPHIWTGGVIQVVQYTCWNQTIPIACRLLCHTAMVCLCPSKSHLLLQTAFIAVFLISTHIFISLFKFKDSRIHLGTLLYPRRRNQGKETAAHTQSSSEQHCLDITGLHLCLRVLHFILIGSCFAPKVCFLETSRNIPS